MEVVLSFQEVMCWSRVVMSSLPSRFKPVNLIDVFPIYLISPKNYYLDMTSNKISSSGEILGAQREYASLVQSKFKPYTLHQINMLINANNPKDATEILAHALFTGFTKLHFLFLFSLNSDEDSTVFSHYSSVYNSLSNEFSMVESSCKKSKVNFEEICTLVMQWTPPYVFNGREKNGIYPWEDGLSELAIELRHKYAKELPDKNHVNVMKEHFDQYGLKF